MPQDLADIAQIIGVLAVTVSLFYVGSQIRQNTSAVRSSTAQAVHDNYASWYMALSNDAELTRILLVGLRDYASLPDVERAWQMIRHSGDRPRSFRQSQNGE